MQQRTDHSPSVLASTAGIHKNNIMVLLRKMDTYDISIRAHQHCYSDFMPERPAADSHIPDITPGEPHLDGDAPVVRNGEEHPYEGVHEHNPLRLCHFLPGKRGNEVTAKVSTEGSGCGTDRAFRVPDDPAIERSGHQNPPPPVLRP